MKRTAIKRRPLADTVLASLEPESKEYREAYGTDRLYFVVSPTGRKRWEVRYKRASTGRWTWLGLGAYPDVPAKVARKSALAIAEQVAMGIDPLKERQQSRANATNGTMTPWRVTAEEWYKHKVDQGYANNTLRNMRRWLDNDALPILGKIPVSRVTRAECVRVQQRVEDRNALVFAEKARGWLRDIFRYAIAHDRCELNPASDLDVVAAKQKASIPFAHLLEKDLPAFLKALRNAPSGPVVRTAAWTVVRTASRPGMVRWMHWDEIDLKGAVWTISAEKMKSNRDHLMPLSRQTIEDLRAIKPFAGRSGYVFPGRDSSPVISHSAINNCFSLIGFDGRMTGHGSRHTAKTLLSEHGWPRDWSEMQLAHALPGLEGVYNRAQWFKQRVVMMQWYADYLDALEAGITDEQIKWFDAQVLLPGGQRFTDPSPE